MKIVSFVSETRESVIDRLTGIAGPGSLQRRTVPFRVGEADVAVVRGGPVEKACMTHLTMSGVTPPEAAEPVDYMVFQLEIFPAHPRCPMGHFNTEWSLAGNGPYHMNLDIFPALDCDGDTAAVKAAMDDVAVRHGADPAAIRNGLDEHYSMDHFDRPLSARAGCKLMHLQNDRLDFFIDAYHAFFESYVQLLVKNTGMPYTEDDMQSKMRRNGKWLEYITLKDAAVKMGLAAGIPPDVILSLSFPPCASF